MKRLSLIGAAALLTLFAIGTRAEAQVTWDWSFGSNTGKFFTDGVAPGGVAAPGVYNLSDFSVTSSGDGGTIGSGSGGEYFMGSLPFLTGLPYSMTWDGSAVSLWSSAGYNAFDWWVFTDNANPPGAFMFGWGTGDLNTASQAVYYPNPLSADVSVRAEVTATPEPATLGLLALGMVGIAAVRRRRARQ